MRKLKGALVLLCIVCALIIYGVAASGGVDTSGWKCHTFEEAGIALLLPEDMALQQTPSGGIAGDFDGVRLEYSRRGGLYENIDVLAAELWEEPRGKTEKLEINGVGLVRVTPSGEKNTAEYCFVGPRYDECCLRLTADGDGGEAKKALKIIKAIASTIADGGDAPAGAVTHTAAAERAGDYLVLVNRRNPIPDGWEENVDTVRVCDSLGDEAFAEREAGAALLALRTGLAADGVKVGFVSPDGSAEAGGAPEYSESGTGLAFDLYIADGPQDDARTWEKIHGRLAGYGFILRWPEGEEYYTGRACEPRHIRFVGKDAAKEISGRGVSLEEYLGADPAAVDYLALVNKDNALPDRWEDEIEIVYMTNRDGEKIGVERTAYAAYLRLFDAVAKEGVHLDINSGWRSVAEQQDIVERYTENYGGDYVRKYVAVPGYSEHHTGLAIDLYLESPDVWGIIHGKLADCGFILRYPQGKESITGYSYEPWHVRYVGVKAAKEIKERGITLEEYLGAA